MGYSQQVDNWQNEKWIQHGVNVMLQHYLAGMNAELNKEIKDYGGDLEEYAYERADNHFPMMNYAYPLELEPNTKTIIEVCTRTSCTVVENDNTGEFFLALTGGGMDLSQDIALAYIIAEKWLPKDLLRNVCTQPMLSVNKADYILIMSTIIEQLVSDSINNEAYVNRISKRLESLRETK